MSEVEKKVIEIIKEEFLTKEEIKPGQNLFTDLGCDDLNMIEITIALEEEFSIEIEDSEFEGLNTVQSIIDLVNRKVPKEE